MYALVFTEVTEGSEELHTSRLFTFKSGAIVHPLMSFQAVECVEIFLTSHNITAIGTIFGVHPYMDLETVGIEKSFPTILFSTLESIFT